MGTDMSRTSYDRALKGLSDLVMQRNELLYELDEMASLPLNISPASGHVAEFDAQMAMLLIQRVDRHNVAIQSALAEANRYAHECGMPEVSWLPMPRPRSALLRAEE